MLLIRRPGGSWRKPETTSYANEKELQALVKASATLIPDTEPSAVVDEFWIPEAGSVDLVAVDRSGALTLVECKLRANPEIRREVVGQILAYPGGLSHMSYDELAAGFRKRAGQSLDSAVAQATELSTGRQHRLVRTEGVLPGRGHWHWPSARTVAAWRSSVA